MSDEEALLSFVVNIATRAGQEIMDVYQSGVHNTTYKADLSPVTQADMRANRYIIEALGKLTPTVPILSEESLSEGTANLLTHQAEIWMVDPLDGTKDFLKHNDEFTVNIALIRRGEPVLGVVYAPAKEILYYGSSSAGAWKQVGSQPATQLGTSKPERSTPIITVSRSHLDASTEEWLENFGPHELLRTGSSLKFCYLADGTADVYPRLAPLMEWDVAAADAILRLVGGSIIERSTSEVPVYNKKDLHQPPFIATGSDNVSKSS
jgi:3'(2'), 5'-bisphosphate nucleotidase